MKKKEIIRMISPLSKEEIEIIKKFENTEEFSNHLSAHADRFIGSPAPCEKKIGLIFSALSLEYFLYNSFLREEEDLYEKKDKILNFNFKIKNLEIKRKELLKYYSSCLKRAREITVPALSLRSISYENRREYYEEYYERQEEF